MRALVAAAVFRRHRLLGPGHANGIQTDAGHGGGKPTSMLIEEQADSRAFVMANLGMDWPGK